MKKQPVLTHSDSQTVAVAMSSRFHHNCGKVNTGGAEPSDKEPPSLNAKEMMEVHLQKQREAEIGSWWGRWPNQLTRLG